MAGVDPLPRLRRRLVLAGAGVLLLPALMRASAQDVAGGAYVEICTADGVRRVPAGEAAAAPAPVNRP